ncbi:MAG: hypothetical protein AAF493_00750 [Pseudomonadota bacterium]
MKLVKTQICQFDPVLLSGTGNWERFEILKRACTLSCPQTIPDPMNPNGPGLPTMVIGGGCTIESPVPVALAGIEPFGGGNEPGAMTCSFINVGDDVITEPVNVDITAICAVISDK